MAAYHWDLTAVSAGLEAEVVRLAGDAVKILKLDGVADTSSGCSCTA